MFLALPVDRTERSTAPQSKGSVSRLDMYKDVHELLALNPVDRWLSPSLSRPRTIDHAVNC